MNLRNEKLIEDLKAWVFEWKQCFSHDLHNKARQQLESLTDQTKQLKTKIQRTVKDIDSLGNVMSTLEDIRREQAVIEMKFGPMEEKYGLLDNFVPGSITDKDE